MRALGERFLTLVTLESKQAGLSLAWMLVPWLVAPVLAITGWLAMFATRALTASGGVPGPAKENGIWALLRTHEDILEASDVGGIANLPKPDRRMLEIGEEIIEHQEGKFDPLTFKDRYEDAVRDVIARKKRGQKMTTAPPVEKDAGKVIDLMDALRRSLAGQGGGSKERAECFLERKKGKAVTKANPKPTNRAA